MLEFRLDFTKMFMGMTRDMTKKSLWISNEFIRWFHQSRIPNLHIFGGNKHWLCFLFQKLQLLKLRKIRGNFL